MLLISGAALFRLRGSSLIPGYKQKKTTGKKMGILPTSANRSAQRKSYPNELSPSYNFAMNRLESISGLRGKRKASNCMIYGIAFRTLRFN